MKTKEYLVLAVVIVLLGSYLLLRNGDRSRYELPVLEKTSADDITRIEITASGKILDLSRNGDRWQIGENAYPADAARVKEMLSVLEKLNLTALVSETGAYSPYDLTEENKIGVRAWAGDRRVRDMAIGKTADTYQHTFVRIGDDPSVYHAAGNFRHSFDQDTESLRDKTALSFRAGEITGIDLVSAGKHLSLSLKDQPAKAAASPEADTAGSDETAAAVWMTGEGAAVNADAVDRLLSQLAYLNCTGYLEGQQKDSLRTPESTITLKGTETYTLSLYEKAPSETECPAVSSQNDYPFKLSETAYTRLTEAIEKIMNVESGDDHEASKDAMP